MADLKDAIEGIKKTIEDAVASGDLIPRADAQAAVALVVERAVYAAREVEDDKDRGHDHGQRASDAISALAPADGLAAVKALRVEARENAMQALASMGQAHEAYEAQLEAEAELAAAQQREAGLRGALEMSCQGWRNALELDLLPKQHRHSAKTMADIADAALASVEGLAAVEALRERAEKAEQERDRIDQWRETAIVERDTYSEERDAAEGRVAALTEALGDMVGLFSADNVLRKGTHMNATLKLARAALAQTPTDPADGWTWNERLGWIGPDGKPADPRRRG